MADYTLSARDTIRPYRCRAGSPRIVTLDASTAVSTARIAVGNVVQFDATDSAAHRLVRSSTGTLGGLLSVNIVGVAAQADESDGSTSGMGEGKRPISVWAANPDTEFMFPAKGVLASTLIGGARALSWDSTLAIHVCHIANSTAAVLPVRITKVINPGDTNGYVVGRFTSTAVAPFVTGL
jgi:hypothetical protein